MQRYRINHQLIIGLFVGSIVMAVALYFLWSWQVNRKAGASRALAKKEFEAGNIYEAYKNQFNFVRLRPDDMEAYAELGQYAFMLMEDKEAPIEERYKASAVLEESARRTGDPGLRRELAKLYIQQYQVSRAGDGLDIVEELLESNPTDHELIELQIQGLYRSKDASRANALAAKVIGYDLKKKEFDTTKATVEDKPNIYFMLGRSLLQNRRTRDDARAVIDRMVEANPESAPAFLKKSIFLYQINEKEEAAEALAKARELDPADKDVLFRIGSIAMIEKDNDKAVEIFRDAVEKHPGTSKFRVLLAQVEVYRKNYDEAMQIVETALAKFVGFESADLLQLKVDIQIHKDDFEGARRTARELENLNLAQIKPIIELVEARINVEQEKWAEAAKDLKRIGPKLIDFPQKQSQAGALLGLCYERLGMPDMAYQAYETIKLRDPNNQFAIQGLKRLGNYGGGASAETSQDTGFSGMIKAMLKLPENEQNWEEIDQYIVKLAEEKEFSSARQSMMRMEVFRLREMYSEANEILQQLKQSNPDDIDVRFAEVTLLATGPENDNEKALELLNQVIAEYGPSFRSRMQKASLLLRLNLEDEELVSQLMDLSEGIDELNEVEQLRIVSALATQLQQLGKLDEASQLWEKAILLKPNNVPMHMQMFDLALRQRNSSAMKEAMDAILEVVKDKNDPRYILTETKRLLYDFVMKDATQQDLEVARKRLDLALKQRPNWHELHIAYGKLLTALEMEPKLALEHFEMALEYGPADPTALVMQIKLLEQFGRFEEALEAMQLLPLAVKRRALGTSEAALLYKSGKQDEAYEAAQGLAEQQKDNVQIQAWFAGIADQLGHREEALAALKRCTELEPSVPQYWLLLASNYLKQKDIDSMHEALNQAQLEVDAEYLPELVAKQYTYRGHFANAEDIYLSMIDRQKNLVNASRRMAEFYLLWGRVDPSKKSLAFPYINKILRETHEGRLDRNAPQATWAREQAVRHLTEAKDYQQVVKAQKLLESGVDAQEMSVTDRLLLAEILFTQRDPKSQLHAMEIFKELNEGSLLQKKHVLMYADILNRIGKAEECEGLLESALPVFQNDPELWSAYINMLIDNKNFSRAAARLNRLEDLDQNPMAVLQLRARLADEKGDVSQLQRVLKPLEPKTAAVRADELDNVLLLARLSARHKEYEQADKWYYYYVSRKSESIPEYMAFLARHGDVEKAVKLMKQQFKENVDGVLSNVIQMLRKRRSEVGDQYDEVFEKMFELALRDDPDSIARLSMQAEFFEVQEQYDKSINAYDKLLQRDDLSGRVRAACMNNLGFLLALKNERLDDARRYVDEAMEAFGPVDDMLDTRAVVYMARDEYDKAVEDMVLATIATKDPIKYYHLAKAQLLAGNQDAALKAWIQAKGLGFENGELPVLERSDAKEIEQKLENLKTTSANL